MLAPFSSYAPGQLGDFANLTEFSGQCEFDFCQKLRPHAAMSTLSLYVRAVKKGKKRANSKHRLIRIIFIIIIICHIDDGGGGGDGGE